MAIRIGRVRYYRNGTVRYHRYVYRPGQRNLYDPEDLEAMRIADAQIEAEFVEERRIERAEKRLRRRMKNEPNQSDPAR